jgi:tetratricopeptide (TPR) repeat protein
MKKTITALLITTLLLTGCSQYDVDKPNLTEEKKAEHEQALEEALETLKNEDISQEEELELLRTAGIKYERLGKYDKAIEYYEKVLIIDPIDFVALNNIAAVYEEVEELELAAAYVVQLYTNYKDRQGVISDTIRILVKNKGFDDAQMVLEEYTRNYQSPETSPFISEKYDYIRRMRNADTEAQTTE